MNKTIKLEDIWIADTNSKKSIVYKTKGFKTLFRKDRYYEASESWLYYNQDNELVYLYSYDEDTKVFLNENDAYKHIEKRKKHWLDWYEKQVKEYTDKVNELKKQ